ncbi:unnamed protein product [Arabis nemorensis]|uniref:Uncharacterized protein n=1 Tax=Arabis nemorensis TaxID=586526 RepID=A0A565AU21_9BRAS|nr:unnamed protein product [Arabis nemorensis]
MRCGLQSKTLKYYVVDPSMPETIEFKPRYVRLIFDFSFTGFVLLEIDGPSMMM